MILTCTEGLSRCCHIVGEVESRRRYIVVARVEASLGGLFEYVLQWCGTVVQIDIDRHVDVAALISIPCIDVATVAIEALHLYLVDADRQSRHVLVDIKLSVVPCLEAVVVASTAHLHMTTRCGVNGPS